MTHPMSDTEERVMRGLFPTWEELATAYHLSLIERARLTSELSDALAELSLMKHRHSPRIFL